MTMKTYITKLIHIRISLCTLLMCIITHSFEETTSPIRCHVSGVFFFPVRISHVSFQSPISAASGCCLLDCLCVTSHVALWGRGICHHKRLKLKGEKFFPCPASRTKEQWGKKSWCFCAGNIFWASDLNELRVLKLSFELCLSSPHGF